MYGVPRDERRRTIPAVLELVKIADAARDKLKTYSKGMKQRLGVAQALLHKPDVIFLDEPTDGVDPVGRREIREMMARLKAEGHTIFLNSHLLGEVEQICDRVAILKKGELVREGTVSDLTAQKGLYRIRLAPGQAFPEAAVRKLGIDLIAVDEDTWQLALTGEQSIDPVVNHIVGAGLNLRYLVEKKMTLEDVFMAVATAKDKPEGTR